MPFRDSALTKLLQNSFGGNSRTAVIVNIAPTAFCGRESLSTLRFGDRASSVKNTPVANEKRSVEELRRLVAEARAQEEYQIAYEASLQGALARMKQV